jgi:hypothetical protein
MHYDKLETHNQPTVIVAPMQLFSVGGGIMQRAAQRHVAERAA